MYMYVETWHQEAGPRSLTVPSWEWHSREQGHNLGPCKHKAAIHHHYGEAQFNVVPTHDPSSMADKVYTKQSHCITCIENRESIYKRSFFLSGDVSTRERVTRGALWPIRPQASGACIREVENQSEDDSLKSKFTEAPCCYQSFLSNLAQTWDLEASWKYLLSFFIFLTSLGSAKIVPLTTKLLDICLEVFPMAAEFMSLIFFFKSLFRHHMGHVRNWTYDLTQGLSWISINWMRQVKTSWCGEWRW